MFTDFDAALEFINSLSSPLKQVFKPGMHIERLQEFLELVGDPHLKYPVIHVGGTAGKGSTVFLTSRLLASSGLKVGVHMSPNLVSLKEKFQIATFSTPDNKICFECCSNAEFVDLVNWLQTNLHKYPSTDAYPLTYYESIIAMVFEFFRRKEVDIAVIEVALGGRFDATNVVASDVAVLNSVGYDHMEILGNTLEEIAFDKMHIMKPRKPFVCGIKDQNIMGMIEEHSRELKSPLYFIEKDFDYKIKYSNIEGTIFSFTSALANYEEIKLNLIGDYQAHNASLTIQAVNLFFDSKGIPLLSLDTINRAFRDCVFQARFHIIQKNPLIILDGAHNELKMRKFVESVNKYFPNGIFRLVFSCKHGKDLEAILTELKNLNIIEFYITEFTKKYYAEITSFPAEFIADKVNSILDLQNKVSIIPDPNKAFATMRVELNNDEIGIVTGSLYLLGNIYEKLDQN